VARIGLVPGGTRATADGTANPVGQYLKSRHARNTCADRDGGGRPKASTGRGILSRTSFTATTLVVLAANLLAASPAQAAPGDLDASFSGDGRLLMDFGGWDDGEGVAVQVDGKILVAGGGAGDFALARHNADGTLDTNFSDDGIQTTDFGGGDDAAFGVAIQPDGKIVAVGRAGGDFALARVNTDGTLDTNFSDDGKQTTDFGGSDYARALAIQTDGKVVLAGDAQGAFAVARFNSDGTLDTTFSDDGKRTTDFGGDYDAASDVGIQADGKIVAVGGSFGAAGGDFALARFNSDGTLDTTFSNDGKQTTDFDGGDDAASDVAIQSDDKIVAVGYGGLEFALARFGPDGTLDATFSNDGKQTTAFGGLWGDAAFGVALQPDGKIVAVGGCCVMDLGGDFALARFNPDGSLDTSFSDDGRQGTDFDGGDDAASDVAIQPDGKIVAVGHSGAIGGTGAHDFALARYEGGSGAPQPGTAPTNSSPPTISGTAAEAETLTVNAGIWSGSAPIDHTYQW